MMLENENVENQTKNPIRRLNFLEIPNFASPPPLRALNGLGGNREAKTIQGSKEEGDGLRPPLRFFEPRPEDAARCI